MKQEYDLETSQIKNDNLSFNRAIGRRNDFKCFKVVIDWFSLSVFLRNLSLCWNKIDIRSVFERLLQALSEINDNYNILTEKLGQLELEIEKLKAQNRELVKT